MLWLLKYINPDYVREIKSGYVVQKKEEISQKNLLKRDSTNVGRSTIIATKFLQEKKVIGIMLQILIYTHRLSLKIT